jgi:DNA-directed RNA polymerase subunit RPC12/RpoP
MRVYLGIKIYNPNEKDPIPTIYVCIDCGDVIEAATKYQIRQDRCPYCFKKFFRKPKQLKLCFILED